MKETFITLILGLVVLYLLSQFYQFLIMFIAPLDLAISLLLGVLVTLVYIGKTLSGIEGLLRKKTDE